MSRRIQCFFLTLIIGLSAIASAACDGPLSNTEQVLWTTCTITLYDHAVMQNLDASFERLREIHSRMTVNTKGSELEAVSAAAGRTPVRVTDDVLMLTKKALQFSALSDGLFDPTVGPLMRVWKMDWSHPQVPKQADIARALRLVNWRDVILNEAARTIFLERPGMELDLGGVLKGYAADEVVRILEARGVKSAIVDLGGNIYAMGRGREGKPWRIGVQNPDSERGTYLGIAEVVDRSVVTSGVYEHYFIKDGKRYHHIMNTRSGYPVDNGLESVTVISQSSLEADGFATTLFCLGKKDGIELGRKLDLRVIMVDSNHKVYVTPGTKELFTITDPLFTYAD